jgi:hypothetical protein
MSRASGTLQERIPMMDLLVAYGANVNAEWHGDYPIIYSACEADVLRGDLAGLSQRRDASPALVHQHFPTLDFGTIGARMLTLRGATLLHVASEYRFGQGANRCFLSELGAPE